MEERIITFRYEFDVTGKRVPVRAIQCNGEGYINCLDITKIFFEIEQGEEQSNQIRPEEVEIITSNIITTQNVKTAKQGRFYAESGEAVQFLLYIGKSLKNNLKEYNRLVDWLSFWQGTAKATTLERIGEHLSFAPLLYQHDKLLESEGVEQDTQYTVSHWLQNYCGILDASLIKSFTYKICRPISESYKTTKLRQPEENESETKIYKRSEFCAILSMIRQIVYGDGFYERFNGYFYKLPKQSQSERNKSPQVRQKFYEYRDSGKLQNISEADLEIAIQDIWGDKALLHTGISQLPYSVDLFRRLLRSANITGRINKAA